MGIAQSCELLEQSLSELVERAGAVRDSISLIRGGVANAEGRVGATFGDAAVYVAGTLTDVSERLRRLEEVLYDLRAHR